MVFKVILIGPIHAGKSTVGRLLAERLKTPQSRRTKSAARFTTKSVMTASLPHGLRPGAFTNFINTGNRLNFHNISLTYNF